jgi:hypothetical protein
LGTGRLALLVVLLVLFALVYVPVMRREAARLDTAFPGAYAAYASRVPLLLPRFPRADASRGGAFSWQRVRANRELSTVVGIVLVIAVLWAKLRFLAI